MSDLSLEELETEIDIPGISLALDDAEEEDESKFIEKVDYENMKKARFSSSNRYGIPDLRLDNIDIEGLVGFNYVLSKKSSPETVHFFLDDYQFVRLWYRPDEYVDKLRRFNGMFSPDFSLYLDFPLSLQIYNTYRNRWVGRYCQECGIKVIPTVGWSDEKSFEFCFLGVPKGSDVAVSTRGVVRSKEAREMFVKGYERMLKEIEPRVVHLYGAPIEGLSGDIRYYDARTFAMGAE